VIANPRRKRKKRIMLAANPDRIRAAASVVVEPRDAETPEPLVGTPATP
jgi:hypothetical protein